MPETIEDYTEDDDECVLPDGIADVDESVVDLSEEPVVDLSEEFGEVDTLAQTGGAPLVTTTARALQYLILSLDPGIVNLGWALVIVTIDGETLAISDVNVLGSGASKLDRWSCGYDIHKTTAKTFADDAAAFFTTAIHQRLKAVNPDLKLYVIVERQYINPAVAGIGMKLKAIEIALLTAASAWSICSPRNVDTIGASVMQINATFKIRGSKTSTPDFRVKALKEKQPELWKRIAKDDVMTTHEADCWWQILMFLKDMNVRVE